MHKLRTRLLCLFLCVLFCAPFSAAFAAEPSVTDTTVLGGKTYRGSEVCLPYFYTVENGGATLTDCLETVNGDAVLPETLGNATLCAIASGAFEHCPNLKSVAIPETVTSIADDAFGENRPTLLGLSGSVAESFAAEQNLLFLQPFSLGDASANGHTGIEDLTLLSKAMAGWDISYSKKGADFTEDLSVNLEDLTALARFMAGWETPTLFVLGDETAKAGTNDQSYFPACGYAEKLAALFSEPNIENLAFSGASAKNTLSSTAYSDLFSTLKNGDAVLLAFGLHDADSLASAFSPATGDETVEGSFAYYLKTYYVDPILARGATPILATPPVSRPLDGVTFTEACLRSDYPEAMRALAEKYSLPLLDVTALSQELYLSLGAEENAHLNAWETRQKESLCPDLLSVFGAEQIAALAADELLELLPEFFVKKNATAMELAVYLATYAASTEKSVFTFSDASVQECDDTLITAESYTTPEGESLVGVCLADGVRSIASGAFAHQYDLETLVLPDTLESIGAGAFHSCNTLKLDALPTGLTTIEEDAFYGCDSLTLTCIPEGVSSLGDYAFYGCNSISSLSFEAKMQTVPANSFRNCRNLSMLSLHEFVETIGARAFEGCALIESVSLPTGLTTIGSRAFKGTALQTLNLPETVTTLNREALAGCTMLAELHYPLVATEWLKVQKGDDWYKDTLLTVITCADGDVTVEDVVLVDYHAYYSDFFTALADANAFTTENADLTRFESAEAKAAILLQDGVLTLKLMEDVVFEAVQDLMGTMTLDLQGHKINFSTANSHFELAENADITLRDSVGGGKVYQYTSATNAQYLYNLATTGSKLTIHGGVHSCENAGGTAMVVRGMGKADSAFTMSAGTLSATSTSSDGNAKAVQAPAKTVITGGAFASKTNRGNSYTVSGIGTFEVSGGTFDSYTHNGDSVPLYVGSGSSASSVEIYNGEFVTHATGKAGTHIALYTAAGTTAVIHDGSFTVDSKMSGDNGACGILTQGPSTVIYDCFAQGNNAGLQALGKDTTVYGGTFIGADHGGAYFSHSNEVGTVYIFGGTFRFELPDWQASTSGTGSAYFNGGGKVYIDGASFENRQVSISGDSGDSPATTLYVSRTTAPSWRVDSMHTVYFGKDMATAATTESGTVDFTTYKNTVFDEAFVNALS